MNKESQAKIRVLVVDDHFVARLGLQGLIGDQADMVVIATANDGSQAAEMYLAHKPDVVVSDLRMPGVDGIAATAAICAHDPEARVLIVSSYDTEADVVQVFAAGARGYITKEARPDSLLDAIRTVARGERYVPSALQRQLDAGPHPPPLTPRELRLLELIADGLPNRKIAQEVSLTAGTVRIYVSNLLAKMGVSSRAEAVALGLQRGMLRRKK